MLNVNFKKLRNPLQAEQGSCEFGGGGGQPPPLRARTHARAPLQSTVLVKNISRGPAGAAIGCVPRQSAALPGNGETALLPVYRAIGSSHTFTAGQMS